MAEKRKNSGSLSTNSYKKTETQPDLKGKANYDCPHCKRNIDFQISGWTKIGQDGGKWLSLSLQEPYKKDEQTEPPF